MIDSSNRVLVLVGLMGAGKSSAGALLACRIGGNSVDLDERIEERVGRTIGEIFGEIGERGFRGLEHEALEEALGLDSAVLSTGGGVVIRSDNRDLLTASGATVVWLRGRPDTLAARLADDDRRPLLDGGDPVAVLARLSDERSGYYEAVSDEVIDIDDCDLPGVVDELQRILDDMP